jgi:hypothetical protein
VQSACDVPRWNLLWSITWPLTILCATIAGHSVMDPTRKFGRSQQPPLEEGMIKAQRICFDNLRWSKKPDNYQNTTSLRSHMLTNCGYTSLIVPVCKYLHHCCFQIMRQWTSETHCLVCCYHLFVACMIGMYG